MRTAHIARLDQLQPDQLPETLRPLWLAHQAGLPIIDTWIITSEFFELLARYHHLKQKLFGVVSSLSVTVDEQIWRANQIKTIVRSTKIPPALQHEYLDTYHQFLASHPTLITMIQQEHLTHHTTTGDASVMESILELWGESLANRDQSLLREQLMHNQVVWPTILLQSQPTDSLTGLAQSIHPETGIKNQAAMFTRNSMGHHYYYSLDPYSQQVTPHQSSSISPTTAKQFLEQLLAFKRKNLTQVETNWTFHNDQIKVCFIRPLPEPKQTPQSTQRLIGQMIVPGQATGLAILGSDIFTATNHPCILVTNQLLPSQVALLKPGDGVVTTTRPTLLILTALQQRGIPTLLTHQSPSAARQGQTISIADDHSPVGITTAHQQPKQITLIKPHHQPLPDSTGLYIEMNQLYQDLKIEPTQSTVRQQRQLKQHAQSLLHLYDPDNQQPVWIQSYSHTKPSGTPLTSEGMIGNLANHLLLEREFDLVCQLAPQREIFWVAGLVRSAQEWALVANLAKQHNQQQNHLEPWLEIATPAALVGAAAFFKHQPAGVVLAIESLIQLWLGIDLKQPYLTKHLDLTEDSWLNALRTLGQLTTSFKLPVLLRLDRQHRHLIEQIPPFFSGVISAAVTV